TVSDPALVRGMEIPPTWGVMAPPSGRRTRTMTVVRPAPRLKPDDTSKAYLRVLGWSMTRARERIERAESDARYAKESLARAEAALAEARMQGSYGRDLYAARVRNILDLISTKVRGRP